MVKFFRVTPPSAHGMVVKLEELGLVTREPGVARSIRVAISEDEIPNWRTLTECRGEPHAIARRLKRSDGTGSDQIG